MSVRFTESDGFEAGVSIASMAAGACAGIVVKAGLGMVPIPTKEPFDEIGFKIGKFIISSVAATAIEGFVRRDITKMADSVQEAVGSIKAGFEKKKDYITAQEALPA